MLSFTAGFVDIVGALTVYDLFTAHVTGTTVRLGEHLAHHDWGPAVAAITIVVVFFSASLAGRVLIEAAQRARFKRIASLTLVLEAVLLLFAVAIGTSPHMSAHPSTKVVPVVCVMLALFAGSMGLQTATLTKIGPLTVHTTFVTGMLNKLAQVGSLWIFAAYDLYFRKRDSDGHLRHELRENAQRARLLFFIWILYMVGAGCGALLTKGAGLKALYVPCCILLAVIVIDQARPLSIEEEQEQAE